MKNILRPIEPRDIMRYYVAYYDIEKSIIESLNSTEDVDRRKKAFYLYINKYMKIGRNFKAQKADEILQILDDFKTNDFIKSIELLSNEFVVKKLVSRPQIQNVKVAASKLLWIFQNNTIIMDNNNKRVLKAKDYLDYVNIWKTQYELKKAEINSVLKRAFLNFDTIINEEWFQMRVFDMYLLSVFSESIDQK